ncbi:MAG: tetratricopeptide repeat protein [Candidatus Gastranaerophilales bacterium]|nr:tetratricopeptide repeat protein [Candidatus Gastranaerophilales bacterium]
MMKKIALVLALTVITAYTTNITLAATKAAKRSVTVSSPVYAAIAKYKQKNYTGCIQDLTPVVEKDANNAVAQYYLGISYTQLGMKGEAKEAYQKVIDLNVDTKLTEYSKRAVACIDGRPECSANYVDKNAPIDDMAVFIKSGKFLDDSVQKQIQEKSLDKLKDQINNDTMPDVQNYKYLNDASGSMNAQPTDKEIADAVRVLAKAGVNPFI